MKIDSVLGKEMDMHLGKRETGGKNVKRRIDGEITNCTRDMVAGQRTENQSQEIQANMQ